MSSFHGDASETEKWRLLGEADIFVLPTHHEGFCVPIVEALVSGCRVIAYDNSNVTSISGGLGTLVLTGDVRALSDAIARTVGDVSSAAWVSDGGYGTYANHRGHMPSSSPRTSSNSAFLSSSSGN